MKVSLYFRWYDAWIGVYVDTKNSTIYWQPLIPFVGIKIVLKESVK